MPGDKIKVVVCGAAGKMGLTTVAAVMAQEDMILSGAFDTGRAGEDAGNLALGRPSGLLIENGLEKILEREKPGVAVDFTRGSVAPGNILRCIEHGTAVIVGTTGISGEDLEWIRASSESSGVPVLLVPNFSIGAVLMMRFAREASRHLEWAEITELHHEKKADAPSGTAMRTAEMMAAVRKAFQAAQGGTETVPGSRGGLYKGIRVHSIRMPGLLAHQEVRLGGLGETLTIRHDSISRECFMPGVMMAIRSVHNLKGLSVGLEHILGLDA
jgi:4-hydroxy-tetrahydrodipicolinate reductase